MSPSFHLAGLTDCEALKHHCWPDRPFTQITSLVGRAIQLRKRHLGCAYVARLNGQACAFGLLSIWPNVGEISDLIVQSDLRGQGIGTALIQKLCQCAYDLEMPLVEIGVEVSNQRAFELYRRLGFTEHRRVFLRSTAEPIIYLRKQLEKSTG